VVRDDGGPLFAPAPTALAASAATAWIRRAQLASILARERRPAPR